MSNLQALNRRIARILSTIQPPAHIFNCTGAREALIADLKAHMSSEEIERATSYVPDEETLQMFDKFRLFLRESVEQTEREYNVRFVSHGHSK